MRRVMVMGPPGSGKSTLARALGRMTGLPVFHLDQVFWRPGWVEGPADEVAAEIDRLAALPAWIIDGNYTSRCASRLASADTVIYLDVPSWLSVLRILRRVAASYGRVRPDLAAGCPERFDLAFLRFAWSWNRRTRRRTLARVEAFAGRTIILRRGQGLEVLGSLEHAPA